METIKTLLLTGYNNHDWRRSSAYCKKVLEETGQFSVDVVENPSEALANRQMLERYSLIFWDYNGQGQLTEEAKSNFESTVLGGAGVVVLHASNNAFAGWTDYEKMMGMAWREEDGSGHGQFHEFMVGDFAEGHPVTQGLKPFKTEDELYHNLIPMHKTHYEVLATAYSDPEKGGSGHKEPIIIVTEHGKGKCFHLTLGHVWPGDPESGYRGNTMIAFENQGFRSCLIRGCLWAAGSLTEK